jgi:2-polyprenyl-3-methyl-5-hydroxy-6-metoxy-1,4-benzoquinol methylase
VGADPRLIDELEARLGGLAGKAVLDLGGGPGQYSVEFARRGADVTWFDVSRNYQEFASAKAREAQVPVTFALGYMDESDRCLARQFDLVFNRICWYYCIDDAAFAATVYRLVKAGGWAYIDTNTSDFTSHEAGLGVRARTWLNNHLGVKIGHPYPPRGRVTGLMLRYPLQRIVTEFLPRNDRILLQKPGLST